MCKEYRNTYKHKRINIRKKKGKILNLREPQFIEINDLALSLQSKKEKKVEHVDKDASRYGRKT